MYPQFDQIPAGKTLLPFFSAVARNDFFDAILKSLGLKPVWDYVVSNNSPEFAGDIVLQQMHYHSTEHMKQVAALALWLLEKESQQPWQYDTGALPLAVACMFHDMNHSLGRRNDAENIKAAQEAFEKYLTVCEDQRIRDHWEIILDLIAITEYPYSDSRKPKNLIERCIRDADILYGMQHDAMDFVLFALCREVNRTANAERPPFSVAQWAAGRVDFLHCVEMYTPTADAVMEWALAEDNDHNHQSKIDSWVRENIMFIATAAHLLKANDVLFIDAHGDTTQARRLIAKLEPVHPYINIYFDDGSSLSLRDGETCIAIHRNKGE